MVPYQVFLGFDVREAAAFSVARSSLRKQNRYVPINGLVLPALQHRGLYTRPTTRRLGKLWDDISGAHMSTEFAISRFLVPELFKRMEEPPYGWALFMDCDVLIRGNIHPLFDNLDSDKAVYCVKHAAYEPAKDIKMDGQQQYAYPRKNWSSVMAFNIGHEANAALTVEMVNSLPGRDLHRFCWLKDDEIGELDPKWNYLVGETQAECDPVIVHFTNGIPTMPGCHDVPYANEWFEELERWAA